MLLLLLLLLMLMLMWHIYRLKNIHHQLTNMPPSLGGAEVDSVVIAAFAALVWHTPTLRQQISTHGTATFSPHVAILWAVLHF